MTIAACPFCPGLRWAPVVFDGGHVVMCAQCGGYGPRRETREAAVEAWNRRQATRELTDLERHEKTELGALLFLLKEQLEAGIESCMLAAATEPREQYVSIVRHDRDTVDVVNGWIARLGLAEAHG